MDEKKIITPRFPSWNEVIHQLFSSKEFKGCGLDQDCLNHYLEQRGKLEDKFVFPLNEPDLITQAFEYSGKRQVALSPISEEEILKKYAEIILESNKFTVIGRSNTMEFQQVSENVVDVLNIDSIQDFSLHRICGLDDGFELYHPEDVLHTIRFGLVAFMVGSIQGIHINPFQDYFEITFRMGFSNQEREMTIHRRCFISNLDKEEQGTRHLDIWRVEKGHDDFSNVSSKVVLSNNKMNEILKNLYFITNCLLLRIEPRDVVLAKLICAYDLKQFPVKLNERCTADFGRQENFFSSAVCHNMKGKLVKKITNRIVENTKGVEYKKTIQNKSFNYQCAQLGVLNLPSLLESCIWKEVDIEQ